MTKTIKTLQLILFLIVSQIALGQTNTEEALSKGREAIELMENGKFDESIKLLKVSTSHKSPRPSASASAFAAPASR